VLGVLLHLLLGLRVVGAGGLERADDPELAYLAGQGEEVFC
jgi:hypothetical protein